MQVNMQLIDLGIASDFKGCRLDIKIKMGCRLDILKTLGCMLDICHLYMLVITRITCIEHMTYASRAYILSALQLRIEELIIHQPTMHTYCNTVIFVPID